DVDPIQIRAEVAQHEEWHQAPGGFAISIRAHGRCRVERHSVNQHAAVNIQRNACQIGRQVTGQEQCCVGNVLRFTQTAQRNTVDDRTEHTGFRGAVVRAAENTAATLRGHRRHAHDAARGLLAHQRNDGLRHQQRAAQTDIEHFVVIRVADVEGLEGLGNTGVVDQHVDTAEVLDGLDHGVVNLCLVGDVG
nr:hypothetical protein [Tanacetum cinerariifolium]